MMLSESNKKRLQELAGVVQEKGGVPRTRSFASKKNSKYRNPEGPSKYFSAYNLEEISIEDIKLPSNYVHDELNQDIWDGDKLRPEISKALKKIAKDFYEYINIDTPIEGIWFTGSLANYNWTRFSDIDVHILVDYSKIGDDKDFVFEYLDSKKDNWNNIHDIKIKGFDVEVYAQDTEEEHRSTGVYDVEKDEWVRKPSKEKPSINKKSIRKKIKSIVDKIEKVESIEDYEEAQEKGKILKNKIKKMRKAGLDKSGEFSEENLVFKYLRNNGFIGRLFDKMRSSYDKSVSVNENEEPTASFEYDENKNYVNSDEVLNIVKSLSANVQKLDANTEQKILSFPEYELTEIPISTLNINDREFNQELVDNYIEQTKINPDYPPIVVDSNTGDIIDGVHRTKALQNMGNDTIRAYVGVSEKNNNMSESIRKIVRKNINEFFNSAGFHASMEDWINKWKKKGIEVNSDSYGDGMDMGFKKGTLLSEDEITATTYDELSPSEYDWREVEIGSKVELEHTKDPNEALKIALDHLKENGNYYSELGECGLIDEKEALELWNKYFGNSDENIEESNEPEENRMKFNRKPFDIDNLEKLKHISTIVYGMTGDEEMAGNMLLSQGDSMIFIPLDMYMDNEMLNNLINKLQTSGYNISHIDEDEMQIDLANPVFSLNENHDNFYTLAPKKHQLMFEKNLKDEHNDNIDDFRDFIRFCCEEGGIKEPTIIYLRGTRDEYLKTTASYNPNNHNIHVYCKGRHKVDIMRSVAHELMHMIQMLENRLNEKSGEDGSPEENEAHSFSGLMIRKYGKIKPGIYEGYNQNKKLL